MPLIPVWKAVIITAHIIGQKAVELFQGMDGIQVKGIEPAFLKGPEMAFYFGFRGGVPDFCMEEHCANRAADQRKLFPHIAASIVCIEFGWDPVSGNGLFEDFLEVISIVIVKKAAAN